MPLAPAAQKSFTKWLAGKRFSRFAFDNRSRRRFPPGDVELKAVHLISFSAASEFVEIEKLVRSAEGVRALGNAIAALIGPQVKALCAAA
jgi:hypothetical protein